MTVDVNETRTTPQREITVRNLNGVPALRFLTMPGSARRGEAQAQTLSEDGPGSELGVITAADLREAADKIDDFGRKPGC